MIKPIAYSDLNGCCKPNKSNLTPIKVPSFTAIPDTAKFSDTFLKIFKEIGNGAKKLYKKAAEKIPEFYAKAKETVVPFFQKIKLAVVDFFQKFKNPSA